VGAEARYPPIFEEAPRCSESTLEAVLAAGPEALLTGGPLLLRNATAGWAANAWDDAAIAAAVGETLVEMMAMPTTTHPTLDAAADALVEPARCSVYVADFLKLTGEAAEAVPFEAYLAQLNLLRLPPLLRGVCLSTALPPSSLSIANLWVGGALMKNGLHFDLYDNLLYQLRGTKRALLFPPADAKHLYYGAATIRRHGFDLAAGGARRGRRILVLHLALVRTRLPLYSLYSYPRAHAVL